MWNLIRSVCFTRLLGSSKRLYQMALWVLNVGTWRFGSGTLGLYCFDLDCYFFNYLSFASLPALWKCPFKLQAPLQIGSMIWFISNLHNLSAFHQELLWEHVLGGPTLKLDLLPWIMYLPSITMYLHSSCRIIIVPDFIFFFFSKIFLAQGKLQCCTRFFIYIKACLRLFAYLR